jgi:hypothetical protein
MIRVAHITDGQIRNVTVAPDDYVLPEDGSQMREVDAIAAGISYYQPPVFRPPAEMWQVRTWLSRHGINPRVAVPEAIEETYLDGPLRWEALARWDTSQWVPFENEFVEQIARKLGLDPGAVWAEILAVV